ncbi:kelch-like protein 10 [Schistocerca nitens]|uniref:kelch-like protein 10 n=1 Tax=Schistocerca nitens TaxID=7011 RepID=UPI0021183C2F|nr:kelch-like protein 10 [Schistocerca nitens]
MCLVTQLAAHGTARRGRARSIDAYLRRSPGTGRSGSEPVLTQQQPQQQLHDFSSRALDMEAEQIQLSKSGEYREQAVQECQTEEVGGRLLDTEEGRSMSVQAMQMLFDLCQNRQLCDAVIRLDDGGAFYVHRNLLSACSSYFRALFTTSLHSSCRTDVLVPGVSSEDMGNIIKYAYLRRADLTPDNALRLLVAADYLCVLGLLRLCCQYVTNSLSPHNCLGVMIFARDHFCEELEKTARLYTLRNFVRVAADSDEVLQLPANELRALLADDDLNLRSEEAAWECVLRWMQHDPAGRREHLLPLLRAVRLGLLDTKYFLEKVKDHPFVSGNEACRPLVMETLRYLYDLEMRDGEQQTPDCARPRVPHELLFAVGGWSGGSPTNCLEIYDTRADQWVKVNEVDPTGPRAYHGTAVIGHDIYVIGGFDGMDYFNSCRRFNVVTKVWREVAPMHSRRCYVSVAMLGDIIYAMGGYDGHHRQSTAERYDHRTNQWSPIAPMNAQRSDASATSLDGRIYITGGFNGQECMNTAEVYDPSVNQWTLIRPMRSRRSGVSCVAYHGCIYVVGGFNGISRMCSAEKYNPATNEWTPIPDMYNPRSNFAIEVIDEMLFAIGGFNGVTTIFHVECYDERTNEWYDATDMNVCRSALSACVVKDVPNVRDYIHQQRERFVEEKRLGASAARQAPQQAASQEAEAMQTDENNNNAVNNNIVLPEVVVVPALLVADVAHDADSGPQLVPPGDQQGSEEESDPEEPMDAMDEEEEEDDEGRGEGERDTDFDDVELDLDRDSDSTPELD